MARRRERDWRRWGAKLKRLRNERDWTQQELAEKVGVVRNSINKCEMGDRRPSLDLLERLARAFHTTLDDLLR